MKLSVLFALPLAGLVFSMTPNCSAQLVALADAPLPAGSSLAYSSSAVADPAVMPVYAPAPPQRVEKPRLHLLDWAGIGAAATLRVLDYTSTEKALEYPQYLHEAILPQALVKDKPAFAAFQAGTVALNYEAYRMLVRHHMRSIARISQYVYIGMMTGQVATNYQDIGKVPTH